MFKFNDVTLRKLDRSDLGYLLELKSETWFNTHNVSILNIEDQIKWFESLDRDPITPRNLILVGMTNEEIDYHSEDCHDFSRLGGRFGVFKITNINYQNRSADVGWDVFRIYRGKKYGNKLVNAGCSICFKILNLHRLNAEILQANIASERCAKNAGFVQEGIKREAVCHDGLWFDSGVWGCLDKNKVFSSPYSV